MSGILPTIVYPSTVSDAQAALLANAQGTNSAVQSCNNAPAALVSGWTSFFSTLSVFCAEQPGWFGLGSMMDQVESYQQQLYTWQQSLASAGCTGVVATNPTPPLLSVGSTSILQWTMYAAVAAAGAYVVGKFVEVAVPIERAATHVSGAAETARRRTRRFA